VSTPGQASGRAETGAAGAANGAAPAALRRAREGNADTRAQILAATERLLESVSLLELSVAQIIAQAEISRATFYFYFSSKFDVVVGLLSQIMDDVYDVARPYIDRSDEEQPVVALQRALDAAARMWRRHRIALRAVSEHWNAIPELRAMWLGVVARFTEGVAAEIDRQRAAGLAPQGTGSRELTAVLLWATERSFHVAGLGATPELPSEEAVVGALFSVWRGAIYAS
jgi:TetR/AcrR family transcriptional regulator, ethionamide resistance regulator